MSSPGSPDVGPEDGELRSARRTLTLFVVAVAAGAIGLVSVVSGLVDEDGSDTTVGSGETDAVGEIGPEEGVDVGPYVDARRARLLEVEGRRAAVVSFGRYVTEPEVDDLIGEEVELVDLFVALPADHARTAPSVSEARASAVEDAEVQLEEIAGLAPTVDEEEYATFYRAELLRYRKLLAEADRDDVVFGAVVIGRAGDLRAIGSRAEVRVVDVGEGADLAEDATVVGLRPEESITTGEPPFRP